MAAGASQLAAGKNLLPDCLSTKELFWDDLSTSTETSSEDKGRRYYLCLHSLKEKDFQKKDMTGVRVLSKTYSSVCGKIKGQICFC